MIPRILVAGVGNIFLGDDGFGVEVARRLAATALPAGVSVVDFGIRGVHLAYQLLDGYETLILIDAVGRDAPPGTVFVIEPDVDGTESTWCLDAHGLDPASVLGLLRQLGGHVDEVLIVGCQPAELREGIGLSEPVRRAVDDAVRVTRELIDQRVRAAAERRDAEMRREVQP